MKKVFALFLALSMIFCIAGCGGDSETKTSAVKVNPEEIKTLGDAFAYNEDNSYSFDEEHFVYVFKASEDGDYYRVVADVPKGVYEEAEKIDFDDEKREEKFFKLLADVKVVSVDNLSESAPSQEELDKYVGKTGKDLLDDGFKPSGYFIDEEASNFYMDKGFYEFVVAFDAVLEPDDDFDEEKAIKDLKILSIRYEQPSSASIDYEVQE